MRSADSPSPAPPVGSTDPAGTAIVRILHAAITRFAHQGVAATSVRAVAADAGVSPALVIHHFGSKAALRTACDRHVAASVRESKLAAVEAGAGFDPLAAIRDSNDRLPVLRYLARTLTDGTPEVAALVDELVADAASYMARGVETGMLEDSEDPHGRAVVLTIWSLGALVLHEHVERLLEADLLEGEAGLLAYVRPAMEILGTGVLADDAYDVMRRSLWQEEET